MITKKRKNDLKRAEIQIPTESYVIRYPEFIELCDTQIEKCFWTHSEIKVEKDLMDLRVNLSESERHGLLTVLKLFVKYELFVGNEYWLSRVMKKFPIPEIQRMASCFGHIENNIHAPFYDKINEVLGLKSDEYYTEYVNDPILKDRMDFINELLKEKDDALSVAGFSFIEGAVLYSSFAYLKHFQSNGKNLMMNVVRGVNQSAIDENLHAIGGAAIYNTLIKQQERTEDQILELHEKIKQTALKVYEHESRIVEMIFEKGSITGITKHQMEEFVKSRVNICLENLGINRLFEVKYNPIADWFYDGLNKYQYNDFFTATGREYVRDWDEKSFGVCWAKKEEV